MGCTANQQPSESGGVICLFLLAVVGISPFLWGALALHTKYGGGVAVTCVMRQRSGVHMPRIRVCYMSCVVEIPLVF